MKIIKVTVFLEIVTSKKDGDEGVELCKVKIELRKLHEDEIENWWIVFCKYCFELLPAVRQR
jgi:Trk-type K+ transport system membrane component